jgi:hypothetical protein
MVTEMGMFDTEAPLTPSLPDCSVSSSLHFQHGIRQKRPRKIGLRKKGSLGTKVHGKKDVFTYTPVNTSSVQEHMLTVLLWSPVHLFHKAHLYSVQVADCMVCTPSMLQCLHTPLSRRNTQKELRGLLFVR